MVPAFKDVGVNFMARFVYVVWGIPAEEILWQEIVSATMITVYCWWLSWNTWHDKPINARRSLVASICVKTRKGRVICSAISFINVLPLPLHVHMVPALKVVVVSCVTFIALFVYVVCGIPTEETPWQEMVIWSLITVYMRWLSWNLIDIMNDAIFWFTADFITRRRGEGSLLFFVFLFIRSNILFSVVVRMSFLDLYCCMHLSIMSSVNNSEHQSGSEGEIFFHLIL